MHFPLILISFIVGYFTKSVGVIWLAVLVVGSEFFIVLSRFIFEYEQAFQGDLVRFWYSALYLFASAYALMHEGHVRVDVLFSGISERKKAWTYSLGSLLLGIPAFRITFVHFPLILISFVIGYFTRTVGFIWLAVLVVASEFFIVVSRFIFEYEQAFQGDLVRFWYSALYLFASAYALMHEGHVRVDVLYTGFSERKKAWTNSMGSLLLGIPLCLIVLFLGMGGKASIINGPVISFEITQQGSNGLYLLFLMAVYLAVFGVTMLIQFTSYFMGSSYKLLKS